MKKKLISFLICLPLASNLIEAKHLLKDNFIKSSNFKSDKKLKLNQALRKLWAEHVIWTKQVVVSFIADLPDLKFAEERLFKNQEDFGKAITPYYGKKAGDQLTKLLKEHISIALEVAKAAKENDSELVKQKDALWRQNAQDIASLLAKANPNWNEEQLLEMLNIHLDLLTDEVTSRLKENWAADVIAFNKTLDEALIMGDALSTGIIKQFPNRFR